MWIISSVGGTLSETKETDCPEAGQDSAPKDVACNETVSLVDWLPLEHNDRWYQYFVNFSKMFLQIPVLQIYIDGAYIAV